MAVYIIRRLLWVILLMFVITAITFIIFTVLPGGDPAALRAGRRPSPELIEVIRQQLGLDEPKLIQFRNYIWEILPLINPGDGFLGASFKTSPWLGVDFGHSFQHNVEVLPELMDRLPVTLVLTGGAALLWLAIGIPIGMLSAIRTRSLADRTTMILALIAISAPPYFVGLVLLYLFDSNIGQFQILPGSSAYEQAEGLFGHAEAMILPWITLATSFAAIYARFLRGNLMDVMSEDYIRTARAKGLSERKVIFRHGVRSAITPIVTLLGLDVGLLLGGAILTETVFDLDGIGRYAYEAIVRNDLPVIQGTVLFAALFIMLMSLVVDIVYAFLDPRVKYT